MNLLARLFPDRVCEFVALTFEVNIAVLFYLGAGFEQNSCVVVLLRLPVITDRLRRGDQNVVVRHKVDVLKDWRYVIERISH